MEKTQEKISEMNDLFDELLEDATEFSKDFVFSIRFLPFASLGIFLIGAMSIIWVLYFVNVTGLTYLIDLGLAGVAFLSSLVLSLLIIRRYYQFKKKYSKFYEIVKESKKGELVK